MSGWAQGTEEKQEGQKAAKVEVVQPHPLMVGGFNAMRSVDRVREPCKPYKTLPASFTTRYALVLFVPVPSPSAARPCAS
jgi:hypothetical protein